MKTWHRAKAQEGTVGVLLEPEHCHSNFFGLAAFSDLVWKNSPKKATDNMLEKSCSLLLDKLRNHIAKNRAYSIESLISGTYVVESVIVQEDFLDNEYRDCLAEF
jgi:hypothetical protein